MATKGTVKKYQTYSGSDESSLSILVSEEFSKDAVGLHNKEVRIITEEEYQALMEGKFDASREAGFKIAKELLEGAHSKVCELEKEPVAKQIDFTEEGDL